MKKIDKKGNCTFAYLNYINSLEKRDLMQYAIGADLLCDKLIEIISEIIEDLEMTLKFNKHYKDINEECIYVDVDHINYLLDILRGYDNENS